MKKILAITKKALKFMSVLAIVGFIGSCDKTEEAIWNDSEAATLTSISPVDAKFGNEVTIEGKYFSSKADNTVSFNGLDAVISSANITTITAIVPEGATAGEVKVTSDGFASNGLAYTIVPLIIPTITSIDPTGGKIGETIIITGTDFSTTPSENEVSFNGTAATVSESTATTITTTVPAGATTGDVTVTRDRASNAVLFTVSISYTVTVQITESIGDVEEASSTGYCDVGSSDLELGEFDSTGDPDYGLQTIGLRFPGINIPVGATILSASIQLTADDDGAAPVEITIYGEDVGNAAVFDETETLQYDVTGRVTTTANVVWDIPEWIAEGDAGLAQQTPNFASIIQAIVDRGDWVSGNSIAIIMKHTGVSTTITSGSDGRQTKSYDDGGDGVAPIITIVYELVTK